MDNKKEELRRQLREQLKRTKETDEERKKRHAEFNRRIREELPNQVNEVIKEFQAICKDVLETHIMDHRVTLKWAYDNEKIGEVEVSGIKILAPERMITLHLNPDIGYIGATAKINFTYQVIGFLPKLPFAKGKEGFFVKIDTQSPENNKIWYMAPRNKTIEFGEDIAIKTIKAVFLE